MCGRVYIAPADPELRELVREMNRSRMADCFRKDEKEILKAEGEICPSEVLPVLATSKAGNEHVFPMKWGFSQKGRLLINARVETAAEKPTFSECWQKHRCVIPVSWYYEWEHDEHKKTGEKYALKPAEPGPVMLAGLYRMDQGVPSFVILTRPAHESVRWMHDRMPVMLSRQHAGLWIRPETNPEMIINDCLVNMNWQKARSNPSPECRLF